jgi:hypothetical protein
MERGRIATGMIRTKKANTGHRPSGGALPANGSADPELVLTSREARQFLRIGRTKLHELTQTQVLPAYRIGSGRTSALRYLKSDLIGWLVRQRVR